MKPYFHEQPYEQTCLLTVRAAMAWYAQPSWCDYPDALDGMINGYIKLVSGKVNGAESCLGCDCFKTDLTDQKEIPAKSGSFAQD